MFQFNCNMQEFAQELPSEWKPNKCLILPTGK